MITTTITAGPAVMSQLLGLAWSGCAIAPGDAVAVSGRAEVRGILFQIQDAIDADAHAHATQLAVEAAEAEGMSAMMPVSPAVQEKPMVPFTPAQWPNAKRTTRQWIFGEWAWVADPD